MTRAPSGWAAICGLLLLSALPVLGGVLRLAEGRGDRDGELLVASLVAIGAHIVAMSLFCVLGAFQFSPALRTRHSWHRAAGLVLIPAGFIAALSSIWLAVFFGGPPEEFALAMVRLVVAVPMIAFLACAVVAITRRNVVAHGAWMTRAYAIAVSGGTQALLVALWSIPVGDVDSVAETWLVAAGFAINSLVAEGIVRRRSRTRSRGRRSRRERTAGIAITPG
ncbi:MAG: DUF2306 domain-containing protein [Microcella sp.]|uniref:DUF2306 domain-containing protein n=1 Tax=Microcella sp. TaxID=1913979 RepID=UPI003315886F